MSTQQQMAMFGVIAMFIGLFLPIVYIPIMGDVNYIKYIGEGKSDGLIMLFLVGFSFILLTAQKFKGLLFTGIASIGVMLFTLIQLQNLISNAKRDLNADLAGNPFRGLADMAMNSFQLQWGWAVLFVGAVLLIMSAIISNNSE